MIGLIDEASVILVMTFSARVKGGISQLEVKTAHISAASDQLVLVVDL
jgi:hypothetical protein